MSNRPATRKTRFLMIGGFLGAGKTTTIARLARHFTDQGLRVGLVTNDQAFGLVDTESLRAQGFDVGEVPGACFCCKFDDLVETATSLGVQRQPDIILTEPVGSCTDLVATVLQPLRHLLGNRYEVGPLAVLCKPEHGRKILGGGSGGFSPQAAYIFLKQLEEAQLIVLNKIDRLTDQQQHELLVLLQKRFPDKRIIPASSTTGEGFDRILAAFETDAPNVDKLASGCSDARPLNIDYDTYAQGESALGWLNCGVRFTSDDDSTWSLDKLALRLVKQFSETLLSAGMEPGHVKVLASADRSNSVANWVSSDAPVELSVASNIDTKTANVLVNLRVHGDPDHLADLVTRSILAVAQPLRLTHDLADMQHFRPGRPEPTHRYGAPTG